jgi:hypothetical protein
MEHNLFEVLQKPSTKIQKYNKMGTARKGVLQVNGSK